MNLPMLFNDKEGKIAFTNQSFRKGFEIPHLKGRYYKDIFVGEMLDLVDQCYVFERSLSSVVKIQSRYYQVESSPVFSDKEHLIFDGTIVLFTDVSKMKEIEDMQKQFLSDVSHELKTPIALIQGYAEGLVENVNSDEESKKYYAEVILDESNKMDKLVRQLLELMKIEYGKREFNDDSFDICELINEVIRKCKVMSEEKQATIVFENTEAINVYADSFYIEQAFTNYITNAIKHVKDVDGRKQIVIKLEDKDEKIRVSVFNTGDNIAEDDIEKIWGRFYKADASRNRADGGTGIGLSLVKAIMNSYNEEYGVINRPDGVEFYFDIKKSKEC